MGFYEEFIDKYDKLISWKNREKREKPFFKKIFSKNKVKSVLDCACGTGQHAIMFSKMGLESVGTDLSPAMVKKAKYYAKKYKSNAKFRIADFTKLPFKKKFDAVICVGNSLPHLMKDSDILRALKEMHRVLNPGGILIVEMRNYDKFLRSKQRFMPIGYKFGEFFIYVFDYLKDRMIFNVLNYEAKTGKLNVYKTEYNPLRKSKLDSLLRKAGFRNSKYYGTFGMDELNLAKATNILAVCLNQQKPSRQSTGKG
ncbi:class I SAM-dependent methyltransferase [Candidatus Woesearchaeota archaeon]|nr:class I SAM-dependent methyltransferase [Candidatus Woesearchaeota archaeon]